MLLFAFGHVFGTAMRRLESESHLQLQITRCRVPRRDAEPGATRCRETRDDSAIRVVRQVRDRRACGRTGELCDRVHAGDERRVQGVEYVNTQLEAARAT